METFEAHKSYIQVIANNHKYILSNDTIYNSDIYSL